MKSVFSPGRPQTSPPVLDLLRERRSSLGQEPVSATLVLRRSLLQRGALIGLALVGSVLGLSAVLLLQHSLVKAQMGELNQYESQAVDLQAQLAARQQKVAAIRRVNQNLAEALTSGRTSSALMTDLQISTPEGVQLTSADTSGGSLLLRGRSFDPLALVRINALQIQLQRSPFFDPKGVQLNKVERKGAGGAAPKPGAAPEAVPLAFEISAPFAALEPARQLAVLRQFGSEGMARRLQLLRDEGLMP